MPKAELNLTDEQLKTISIFFPHAMKRTFAAIEANLQFVHYCDASAAVSMIQNKEVWMRNATWMNDTSEITYGTDRLFEAAKGPDGVRLRDFLEKVFPGFVAEFDELFCSWLDIFQEETYITCLTELLEDEQQIGRLSMWRAYGKSTAVAIVINGGPLLRPSDALNAYTSPVAYLSTSKFNSEFRHLVDSIL